MSCDTRGFNPSKFARIPASCQSIFTPRRLQPRPQVELPKRSKPLPLLLVRLAYCGVFQPVSGSAYDNDYYDFLNAHACHVMTLRGQHLMIPLPPPFGVWSCPVHGWTDWRQTHLACAANWLALQGCTLDRLYRVIPLSFFVFCLCLE